MIGLIAEYVGELVEIRIDGSNIYFKPSNSQGYTTIEGLRLSKEGCVKENPDLKDRQDWREESIKRLKQKLKEMETETQVMEYVIQDLTKVGYKFLYKQRAGFRVEKL